MHRYRTWLRIIGVLLAIGVYAWSWRVVGIDPRKLVEPQAAQRAREIFTAFLTPEILVPERGTQRVEAAVRVPCESGNAPGIIKVGEGPQLFLPPCASPGTKIRIRGEGFRPHSELLVRWIFAPSPQLPLGGELLAGRTQTDAAGRFELEVEIRPLLAQEGGARLQAEARWEGRWRISPALIQTLELMVQTIFLALMATTLATGIAAPLSFLAARNITARGPVGVAIYYAVRTVFNVVRSIEPLVVAAIFATWVGFGPFAGVLALTVATVVNLGKLFSEVIETIDPGPVEALTATGANTLQVIRYAVIPQITLPFLAFIIYHWDINIRISTVVGFVGGGGIGYQLKLWIDQTDYHKAGTAVWAIVAVVSAMDYVSARLREAIR
ncbi:MAG TPA: phosphonate ABC transporter, permease protein PhnE [Thermoflexus sp.]|nr:phosphonate ABC transporter, permease protein PhnE [Thermoflexus sp.]